MLERPKGVHKEIAIKLRALEARSNKKIEDIGIFTFQKFENAFYSTTKGTFDKNVTTYYGRHNAATIMKKPGASV